MIKQIQISFLVLILIIGCSNSPQGKLYCVKFTSNIKSLKSLIDAVNEKNISLPCSSIRKVKISKKYSSPEDASKIWSLYNSGINYQIFDISLKEFLNNYFADEIGQENCKLIIDEVTSWLDHPQIEEHVAKRIEEALGMKDN